MKILWLFLFVIVGLHSSSIRARVAYNAEKLALEADHRYAIRGETVQFTASLTEGGDNGSVRVRIPGTMADPEYSSSLPAALTMSFDPWETTNEGGAHYEPIAEFIEEESGEVIASAVCNVTVINIRLVSPSEPQVVQAQAEKECKLKFEVSPSMDVTFKRSDDSDDIVTADGEGALPSSSTTSGGSSEYEVTVTLDTTAQGWDTWSDDGSISVEAHLDEIPVLTVASVEALKFCREDQDGNLIRAPGSSPVTVSFGQYIPDRTSPYSEAESYRIAVNFNGEIMHGRGSELESVENATTSGMRRDPKSRAKNITVAYSSSTSIGDASQVMASGLSVYHTYTVSVNGSGSDDSNAMAAAGASLGVKLPGQSDYSELFSIGTALSSPIRIGGSLSIDGTGALVQTGQGLAPDVRVSPTAGTIAGSADAILTAHPLALGNLGAHASSDSISKVVSVRFATDVLINTVEEDDWTIRAFSNAIIQPGAVTLTFTPDL